MSLLILACCVAVGGALGGCIVGALRRAHP
jgi:hypothetical protein